MISIGHALTHWYPATFYLLLPLIGKELGLSYGEIGSILTCQYAAGAIANMPGGIFVDTVGRKGLLMAVSLCWIGFPYLVMGFSHTYWMILVCATLVGIGNNLWHPTAIPWLADRFPDRKGLVMSFHSMGGNVGDAVAPLVMGALLQFFTWRNVVMMNVVPGIVVAGIILIYVGRLQTGRYPRRPCQAEAGGVERRGTLALLFGLLKNRALVTLAIGSGFRSMTQGALLAFLPLYLAREMGYPSLWIGGACSRCRRRALSPRRSPATFRTGRAPADHHVEHGDDRRRDHRHGLRRRHPWFVLLVAVLGFFLFAVRAVLQAWLLDATPPGMGGSAIGVLFGVQALGQALGPISAGIVADHYGLMAAFYFLAGTIVVANLMVFVTPAGLRRTARPQRMTKPCSPYAAGRCRHSLSPRADLWQYPAIGPFD